LFDITEPSTELYSVPSSLEVQRLENSLYRSDVVEATHVINVDPVADTVVVDGVTYSLGWSDGISEPIKIDSGMSIYLRGTLPGSSFTFTMDLVRMPERDLVAMLADLKTKIIPWDQVLKNYKDSYDFEDRIAAYVLNYILQVTDGEL
jgi:hypothetical protein